MIWSSYLILFLFYYLYKEAYTSIDYVSIGRELIVFSYSIFINLPKLSVPSTNLSLVSRLETTINN